MTDKIKIKILNFPDSLEEVSKGTTLLNILPTLWY